MSAILVRAAMLMALTGTSAAAPSTDALLGAFVIRVELDSGATARQRKALASALATLVRTRLGRELAEQFVREGARVRVEFADLQSSSLIYEKGWSLLQGVSAQTDTTRTPPVVRLDTKYLNTDAEYLRVYFTGDLAHEVLGHALQAQRARRTGVSLRTALWYNRADEVNASAIAWIVEAELGSPLEDPHRQLFVDAPELFDFLLPVHPAYAALLSREEMRDAVGSLRIRLKETRDGSPASETLRDAVRELSSHGAAQAKAMRREADSEYLARLERRTEEYRLRLRALITKRVIIR